jgi:hypothetical protein
MEWCAVCWGCHQTAIRGGSLSGWHCLVVGCSSFAAQKNAAGPHFVSAGLDGLQRAGPSRSPEEQERNACTAHARARHPSVRARLDCRTRLVFGRVCAEAGKQTNGIIRIGLVGFDYFSVIRPPDAGGRAPVLGRAPDNGTRTATRPIGCPSCPARRASEGRDLSVHPPRLGKAIFGRSARCPQPRFSLALFCRSFPLPRQCLVCVP